MATMRREYDQVGHEGVGARWLVEFREGFSSENRHKADNGTALLSNKYPPARLGAARLDVFPVAIGHRFAWTKSRIDGAFDLLQLNYTLTHRRGVIVPILSDYEIHGMRCRAAVSLNWFTFRLISLHPSDGSGRLG
jgi:hypothetical protein